MTTVKQLIELLQAMPQDLPVYLADWNEGWAPDHAIDESDLPRVVEARVRPPKWDHPQRVLIGG